jgi:hypothetical protein
LRLRLNYTSKRKTKEYPLVVKDFTLREAARLWRLERSEVKEKPSCLLQEDYSYHYEEQAETEQQ